jgi:hypothetical protein
MSEDIMPSTPHNPAEALRASHAKRVADAAQARTEARAAKAKTTCAYCGGPAGRYHSGVLECQSCWDWRKLDGPAARHWARVGAEFLSNVDMYDLTRYFAKCGLDEDEAGVMLRAARKLAEASQRMIDEPAYRREATEAALERYRREQRAAEGVEDSAN